MEEVEKVKLNRSLCLLSYVDLSGPILEECGGRAARKEAIDGVFRLPSRFELLGEEPSAVEPGEPAPADPVWPLHDVAGNEAARSASVATRRLVLSCLQSSRGRPLMSDQRWRTVVMEFVYSQIREPARVLEIGCGDGYLASALSQAGHSVVAVDPDAPDGAIFRRMKFEELDDPGPFDLVVAVLALHHVEDLGDALDKASSLLAADGVLALIEFGWDRLDDQTARWLLERMRLEAEEEHPSWAVRCCREWITAKGRPEMSIKCHCEDWATSEGIHSADAMRTQLGRRFTQTSFAWIPFLYQDLADTTEEDERRAIADNSITPVGFRYVGKSRVEQRAGRHP
jgi:SAM-dependent methyltransferase